MFAAAVLVAAAAPASLSAKAFVDGVYARWQAQLRRGDWRYQPPRDRTVWTAEMAALFAKDARIARRTGDIGMIDAVPLCACQDDAGLRAVPEVVRADARTASVRVRLRFGATAAPPLLLDLVRERAGWRVADVRDDGGSLRARLHAGLDGQR